MGEEGTAELSEEIQPKRKLAFIDGMRGIAALYVVLGHLCVMVDPNIRINKPTQTPLWIQDLMAPFWYGHLAVAAFIVISGFCLQMSLFDRGNGRIASYKAFFSRRARRILPAYYACLIFSLIVVFTVTEPSGYDLRFAQYLPVTTDNVLAHVFLYHNIDPGWMYKINGVLWSIAIEVQLYLLFPLLLLGVRLGRFLFAGLLALAVALTFDAVPAKLYLWYGALFVLGMAFANLAYRPVLRKGTRHWIAFLFGAVFLAGAVYASAEDAHIAVGDSLIGVATAAFLYGGLVAPWSIPARIFAFRPFAVIGLFSYSLYLIHHPLQQLLYILRPEWAVGPENELLYMMALCLPIILAASYLFYRLFERPFMTQRRRRAEALEESQILQGQHQEGPKPEAVAAPAFAVKSAYGVGRRRRSA
jgi:peptidoglycan/LPS O-acetylase OafA/YrhL